jgi:hypothetical protein
MMSASLVAVLGFVVVVTVDKYVDSIYLPRNFLALFIVLFTMSFGVIWEFLEFANDQLLGTHLQYSLQDTMVDLLFDAFGGSAIAFAGSYYLTNTTPEHFVEKLGADAAKEKIKVMVARRRWRV